ncbi:MAG: hypothetical protein ACK5WE_06880, partial [bacterium]
MAMIRNRAVAALAGLGALFTVFTAVAPAPAVAAGSNFPLQRAPVNLQDAVSLQRGAHLFVN